MGCEIDGVSVGSLTPRPLIVKLFDTITLTNSPATVREILNSATYRLKLDLTGFTQYRLTMWVATQGISTGDIHLEGSADGTNFGDLDAAASELSLYGVGSKDTGWKTIQAAYRADNVFIRMMEKDGDGVADPVLRQVILMFK